MITVTLGCTFVVQASEMPQQDIGFVPNVDKYINNV